MIRYEISEELSRDLIEAARFDVVAHTTSKLEVEILRQIKEADHKRSVMRTHRVYVRDNPDWEQHGREPATIATTADDDEWHTLEIRVIAEAS